MNGKIYIITNQINGKYYIGQSIRSGGRFKHYMSSSQNPHFWNSVKKYGKENFIKEILLDGIETKEKLNEYEKDMIYFYDATNPEKGYNLAFGGQGGNWNTRNYNNRGQKRKGQKHTEETKKKISNFNKGNKYRLGKIFSEESKKKISEKNKGKHLTEETKKKISDSLKGREFTEDHKRKIGLKSIGNKSSLGRKFSEETKKKISNSRPKKAVYQINRYNKEIIQEFLSLTDAFKKTKVSINDICSCCRKRQPTAGGFIWKYVKEIK